MTPRVSIIITTYNRAEHLRSTLKSIGRVRIPPEVPTELLVVDNASTDDTAQAIQTCRLPNLPVRYLYEPKRGQSNARNSGMEGAQGRVIVFTDDDVRFAPSWLDVLTAPLLAGTADAVAGGISIAPHLERDWTEPLRGWWLTSTHMKSRERPGDLIGANMAFSRCVLGKVPAFDPELGPGALGFADDSLFSRQLQSSGFRIAFVPAASVEHHFDEARLLHRNLIDLARRRGLSKAYFDYHWRHKPISRIRLKSLKPAALLWRTRFLRPTDWLREQGAASWELEAIRQLAYYRGYLRESKRRRNYQQHGLTKLPG